MLKLTFLCTPAARYGNTPAAPITHVPPGWTKWVGLRGNSAYYNYDLSIDGVEEKHGSSYATDYLTDLVANRSVEWLSSELLRTGGSSPVLTVVHCPSPHRPAMPAPQCVTHTPTWPPVIGLCWPPLVNFLH